MTIAIILTLQRKYHCDTITIVDYHCNTIVILLSETFMLILRRKLRIWYHRTVLHILVPFFVWKQEKNFTILSKFTYFAE